MTRPFPDPPGAVPPGGMPTPAMPIPAMPTGGLPAAAVPPGWYQGPLGVPQWWDGRQWGPPAPPRSDNTTTMALFSHLGTFLAGFLVPLIILLTEGKRSRFVKHHATEALNWSITTAILGLALEVLYLGAFVLAFGGFATGAASGSGGGAAAGFGFAVLVFVVVIVVAFAMAIASVVFTVIGAVKAGGGAWWRYPVCLRLVKGAASKQEVASLNAAGAR